MPVFLFKWVNIRSTLTILRVSIADVKREVIRIAVTGHRFIVTHNDITTSIQKVLDRVIQDYPGAEYHLLSALSEGSDQFVVRIALQNKEIKLIVPLPLPEEQYLLNFKTEEGRKKFTQLFKIAYQVIRLTENSNHDTAYDYLASYLIDQCHVLIALWIGESSGKRGGTGEVGKKALNAGRLVYWIYLDNLRDGALNSQSQLRKSGEIQVLGSNRDS